MKTYATWLLGVRRWVIAAVLALTALLGAFAPPMTVSVDPSVLVPANNPAIQAIDSITAKFGSKYMVLIGITPKQGDIYQRPVLERVARITQALRQRPEVVQDNLLSLAAPRVRNISGHADGFDAKPLMAQVPADAAQMDQLRGAIAANPVYQQTIVSADQRTAAILVELKEGSQGVANILAPIQAIVDAERGPEVDIALGGNPVYIAASEVFGARINLLFPLAIVVIGLLHFEAFRTKQGLVLPLVTALMAVVWGMGAMGLLGQQLDIFNSPTPILILAVAAGHAVQLLKRYYDDYARLRAQGMEAVQANHAATIASLVGVGPVMLIAGGVAALGFFSLVVFDVPTIRSFGIFTGVGILSAVLLEMSFIPAVRSLLRPPSDAALAKETRPRIWDRVPAWLAEHSISVRGRRVIFGSTLAALALFATGMSLVQVDNASKRYFGNGLQMQRDDQFLNQQLAGTNTLYLMVEGTQDNTMQDPKVLASIAKLQRHIEAQPDVGKTLSIADFVQRMHRAVHADDAAYDVLPSSPELVSQYLFLYAISGQPTDFDAYVDYNYRAAKVMVLLKTGSNARIKALMTDLAAYSAREFGPGITLSFGGDTAMTVALSDAMVYGKLQNILQICVAVFLITAVVFRSVLGGLLVLLPVLLATAAVFGVMGLAGIPLNIPNSLISAMAVGIGADYAIYILYRLRELVRRGASDADAVRSTMASAGKACLFVATAVAGGYGVLALSFGYNVHQWLSMFIVLAMLVSALASLTLVPAIVLWLRPAFIFGRASRRSGVLQVAASVLISSGLMFWAPKMAHADPATDAGLVAATLMQKSADALKVRDSVSTATFSLTNRDGAQRQRQTTGYTKLKDNGSDSMRTVLFTAPPDISGTATLMVEHAGRDDDLWVYLPALKKVRRLAAANKRDSFVGTDFSYGDMLGHKVADWDHRVLRDEVQDGVACVVIESLPRDASVQANSGYSKRLSWLRKDNAVTTRVDTWDSAGQAHKRMLFADIRAVGNGGKFQPMRLLAENLQSGHRTSIEFTRFEADKSLGDQYFSPRYLEQ